MTSNPRRDNLISVADLNALLVSGAPMLLDVRQVGPEHPNRAGYLDGHLPGAQFADLDADLAGTSTGSNGRRPLPHPDTFQATVRRWGIDRGTPVVVYGATRSAAPARAWWLLRWAGVESVKLLDGGLDAWASAGGALAQGHEPRPAQSEFVIKPGQLPNVELPDVAELARVGRLIDARPAVRFAGTADGAGHIPGAINVPADGNFTDDGYLLPADELQVRFMPHGLDTDTPFGAYCGSGVAAAMEVFVLATLGRTARLYVGSASEWTADPNRPLVR
ncbi:sulfurtransferase [Phytohabitans kaempferiae]|uniref:Sulfurtransferase n=1 Tax=Phytohabitans kaempferiae TaxID=1620943 RepID=A0ABV6MHM2_9ACTN